MNLGIIRRNFDIMIILAAVAIIPFAGAVEDYYVSTYSSVASGAGLMVYFAALGMVIIGLVLRIHRMTSGRL